ncbi:hypothetical protein V5E97_13500 [Singulisphaera sp. Ch08]|uniref:Uncharacterized protein n=1 Tax=Singulisphaera sp. Ch08 TaxID=3120278 RepID=A0AAU7CPR5_9BACT
MSVSDYTVEPHILAGINDSADEGAALADVTTDDPPLKIVTAINTFVSKPRTRSSGHVDNWLDRALPLGSLWGQQMVRQFNWEWSGVVFQGRGDTKAIGVFSKDRSLAIYPWHFVFGCLENNATVTILLSFNMLLAGKIPAQKQGDYVNLMDHVHHIIPPG